MASGLLRTLEAVFKSLEIRHPSFAQNMMNLIKEYLFIFSQAETVDSFRFPWFSTGRGKEKC